MCEHSLDYNDHNEEQARCFHIVLLSGNYILIF